jgi:4-amino-4-deoxy-L-arabinose transferase-like glycosyltransferase
MISPLRHGCKGIQSIITTVILFCLLLILLVSIKTPFKIYDEGSVVFNATRIMNGDVPYRDFWAIYPPGQFYSLATLFRIFGTTLFVVRIYDTIVRFVIVISLYFIAKKITSRPLALLVCIFSTLLLASARFYAYPVFPSMALILLSFLSLFEYYNTKLRRWLFLTGVLTGISVLFRWDIGLYSFISVIMTIVLFHFFYVMNETKSSGKIFFVISEQVFILSFGVLLFVLPFYGYWCLRSGFNNLWSQIVTFPALVHRDLRWKPYPSIIPPLIPLNLGLLGIRINYPKFLNWLQFYLPIVVYCIAIIHFFILLIKKRLSFNIQFFGSTALLFLGVLLFAQALSRYDYIHILPSSIIALLILIFLVDRLLLILKNLVIKYSFILLLTLFIFIYFISPVRILLYTINNFSPFGCYSNIERAGCVYIRKDQEQAVEYIRAHTKNSESIFVGNRRHDIIFLNDIGFYFLSNRPSATKYHELFPGVATTLLIQEVIVRDIELKNVNWIVFFNEPESGEPNASSVYSGVHFLDDFIHSEYAPVTEFGSYGIWNKRAN